MDRKDDVCTHVQRREQTTHSEPQKKLLPNLQENQSLISIDLDEEDVCMLMQLVIVTTHKTHVKRP
jgi:hypothetical protein